MPSQRQIAVFLRPAALVLLGFAVVAFWRFMPLLEGELQRADFIRPGAVAPEHLPQLGADQVVLPTPELSPAEVVETQLAGLADRRANGIGILQCYCFASPANRAFTGPLDRFGQMVRQGPFACLASPAATLVGQPRIEGPLAKLLVTIADDNGQIWAFAFILSRQTDEPFKDCWMTEAVLPVGTTRTTPDPQRVLPDSA